MIPSDSLATTMDMFFEFLLPGQMMFPIRTGLSKGWVWAPRPQFPCVQSEDSSNHTKHLAGSYQWHWPKGCLPALCMYHGLQTAHKRGNRAPRLSLCNQKLQMRFPVKLRKERGAWFSVLRPHFQTAIPAKQNSFYEQKKSVVLIGPALYWFQFFSLAHSFNYWEKNATSNCANFQKQYFPHLCK